MVSLKLIPITFYTWTKLNGFFLSHLILKFPPNRILATPAQTDLSITLSGSDYIRARPLI